MDFNIKSPGLDDPTWGKFDPPAWGSSDPPPWGGFEGVVTTLCVGCGYDDIKKSINYPRWICSDVPSSQISLPHELDLLNSIKEAFKTLKEFPTPIALIVRDFAIPLLAYLTDEFGLRSIDIESGVMEMLVRSNTYSKAFDAPQVDPKDRSVYFTNSSQILRLDRQTKTTPSQPTPTPLTNLTKTITKPPTETTTEATEITTMKESYPKDVSVVTGKSQTGFRGGSLLQAEFHHPRLVPFSCTCNELVVYDSCNFRMRLIDMTTGSVTIIAGNGELQEWKTDGPTLTTPIGGLLSIIPDPLHPPSSKEPADLICTTTYSSLRRLNRRSGYISSMTIGLSCDIIGTPSGWCLLTSDSAIYACDLKTGHTVLIAGCQNMCEYLDGPAFTAKFSYPFQPLYVPPTMIGESPSILIPDGSNNAIRRLTLAPFFAIPPN